MTLQGRATDDIWTKPIVTSGEAVMRVSAGLGRIGEALERLADAAERVADASEQRNIIDEKMADFAAILQRGAGPAEDVELAPDGQPRRGR